MYRVLKRDGVVVDFDVTKISEAIQKAFVACDKQYHPTVIDMLALRVTSDFETKIKNGVISSCTVNSARRSVMSRARCSATRILSTTI